METLITPLNLLKAPTGNLSMAGFNINNLGTPVNVNDAVSKTYVDSNFLTQSVADTQYYASSVPLD